MGVNVSSTSKESQEILLYFENHKIKAWVKCMPSPTGSTYETIHYVFNNIEYIFFLSRSTMIGNYIYVPNKENFRIIKIICGSRGEINAIMSDIIKGL